MKIKFQPILLLGFGALVLGIFLGLQIQQGFSLREQKTGSPTINTQISLSTPTPLQITTPTQNLVAKGDLAKVVRVIDGDTIELENDKRVRYIGIDAPELADNDCYSIEAAQKNRQLVEGKLVRLEKDVSETDKFGRLLRYVYLEDIFVNDFLVREGFASVSTFPPDVKFSDQFLASQREARENNAGLWAPCARQSSLGIQIQQFIPTQAEPPDPTCTIKGNISSAGEKIYHLPGQKYYDKTIISPSKGERWFCTEEEAVESGWRKSKI